VLPLGKGELKPSFGRCGELRQNVVDKKSLYWHNTHMKTFRLRKASLKAIFAGLCLVAVGMPFFAFAQGSVRYGYESGNSTFYLVPNRGLAPYPSTGPVAAGISVSCSPSMLNAAAGQVVTWFSSVTGGNGVYYYAWNGTEGLSGTASTLQKIYASNGEKFTTLTVTSGSQTVTVSCGSVHVGPAAPSFPVQYSPGASCYATPERAMPGEAVTWLAIVSGVTASTTYMWDGTESLSGDRPIVSKTYTTNGIKAALLTVTTGGSRIVAACTNSVTVGPKTIAVAPSRSATPTPPAKGATLDVQGVCAPSATSAGIGEEIRWQVAAVGGTGAFQFLWQGDDAFTSAASSAPLIYTTTGTKKASVTITSGDKSIVLPCTPVEITDNQNGLLAASWFSKIDGPLCFILAALLAILVGISIARRRKAKEDEDNEDDYKKTPPPPSNLPSQPH